MSYSLPDNRTRSVTLSPLLANLVCRVLKLKAGAGMFCKASVEFDTVPSLRPVGTLQNGPPYCCSDSEELGYYKSVRSNFVKWLKCSVWVLTIVTTESLATSETTSAHETIPGHSFSSKLLTPSMKPKPRTVRFGGESFSAVLVEVEFNRRDASQPWQRNNEDKISTWPVANNILH